MPSINATVSFAASSGRQRIDEIHLRHQRALGGRILALVLGDAFHRDVALPVETFGNAEARRPGRASTNIAGRAATPG